jgi:hypothetical protein
LKLLGAAVAAAADAWRVMIPKTISIMFNHDLEVGGNAG